MHINIAKINFKQISINIAKVDFGLYDAGGGVTPEPEPEKDYLCFTSTGDSTVSIAQYGTPTNISKGKVFQYKLNDGEWQTWNKAKVSLSDGDKMYLKSDDEIPMAEIGDIYRKFIMTGSIAVSGNIMSLLNFSTTLPDYAFYKLFAYCPSLTTAPELPVTTLSEGCYKYMFKNCTSLTTAPELPATTLAPSCYSDMFSGCKSLVTTPTILPATTLTQRCYISMFEGCTSLTTAPTLPATDLVQYCYSSMFSGCTKLNYVKAMFTTDPTTGKYMGSWLSNVSPTGTFIKSKDATWTNEQAGIPTGWTVQVEGGVTPEPEPAKDYLCFTSTGDSTVAIQQKGTPDTSANKVIQYKLNNGQWQTWDLSAVTLHDGDKMYLKSDDEIQMSEAPTIYKKFVMTGSIAASGNIMSLLNFSTTLTDFVFKSLFYNCKSLTTAPELPAITLASSCYSSMFQNCTNLNYVKAMFTTDPSAGSYNMKTWLDNVSPTGTFVKNAAATWTNDAAGIPTGWTVQTASPDK